MIVVRLAGSPLEAQAVRRRRPAAGDAVWSPQLSRLSDDSLLPKKILVTSLITKTRETESSF